MVTLFEHNHNTYLNIVEMFKYGNRVGVVQPTGTGKSFLILKWIEDNADAKTVVISPSVEIFKQLQRYAKKMNVFLGDNVQLFTYSKINEMTPEEIKKISVHKIVLDEFHRAGAEQWGKSIENFISINENAQILGLTATPVRYLDNARNMADELFNGRLACEMTLGEAVKKGILPAPEYIPVWYDYDGKLQQYQDGIEKIRDPKEKKKLEKLLELFKKQLENSYGTKEIFSSHINKSDGKYIVFCKDEEHISEIKSIMKDWLSGVSSQIHSYITLANRTDKDRQIEEFISDADKNAVKLLYSIDRLNEGLHVDDIDGVIMLRPTESAIIYLQQMGRALSSGKEHKPIVFDLVNNYSNVRVVDGKGTSYNVFEKEIYDATKEQNAGISDKINFQIFEKAIEFNRILETLDNSLAYDNEKRWNTMYELYKSFKIQFGREPKTKEIYQDTQIGYWCSTQKVEYNKGNLNESRIMLLKDAGFSFDYIYNAQWGSTFEIYKEFKEKFGREPKKGETYNNVNIAMWCGDQKKEYRKGKLDDARIALLENVGFCFDYIFDAQWLSIFEIYKEFKEKFGREPKEGETYNNVNIGSWCNTQRKAFKTKKLDNARIELLEEEGFSFDNPSEKKWITSFEVYKKFKDEFNREPKRGEFYHDIAIGTWCNRQKSLYNKGKLDDARIELLEEAGFCFENIINAQWNLAFEAYKEFKQEYGREPQQREKYNNVNIGAWCNYQKNAYKKGALNDEYMTLLKEAGFCFENILDTQWNSSFEIYKDFKNKYEREPRLREAYNNINIGAWCNSQRKAYKKGKLNDARVTLLKEVGFFLE